MTHGLKKSSYILMAFLTAGLLSACGGSETTTASESSNTLPTDVSLYETPEAAESAGALEQALGSNYRTPYAAAEEGASTDKVSLQVSSSPLNCACPPGTSFFQCAAIKARTCNNPSSNPPRRPKKASSSGEPHLQTFDGLKYDSHAEGTFWLLEDSEDEFSMQAIQKFWDSTLSTAYNSAIAVKVFGHTLVFYTDPTDRVTLDGTPLALINEQIIVWPGAVLMRSGNDEYALMTANDHTLLIQFEDYLAPEIAIRVPEGERYRGLLGDTDDSAFNDLNSDDTASTIDQLGELGAVVLLNYADDNTPVYRLSLASFYDNFIAPWVVDASDSLFHSEDYVEYRVPITAVTLSDFSEEEETNTRASCLAESGLEESNAVFNCVFDVLAADTPVETAASIMTRLQLDPDPTAWIEVD